MDKRCNTCYWKGTNGCLIAPLCSYTPITRGWLDVLISIGYDEDDFIEIKPNLWRWKYQPS